MGDRVHSLTLGRSLGFLEQALDLLAVVEPGEPPEPDALLRSLAPHLPRLSCVILLALAWDAPRHALRDRLAGWGVGCTTLLVTFEAVPARDVTVVSPRAISTGEPLSL